MSKSLKQLTFANLVSTKQISVECTGRSFTTRTHIDTKADVQIRHIDQHKDDTQLKRNREWVLWVQDSNGQVAPLCKVSLHPGSLISGGRNGLWILEGRKGSWRKESRGRGKVLTRPETEARAGATGSDLVILSSPFVHPPIKPWIIGRL